MVGSGRREEIIPSAARLLGSLRDLGYDFTNAVADLMDNSITAEASKVDVTIAFNGPDSWVRIADNGAGMSADSISEAMRLGSTGRGYGSGDLGKFGLGLKTASLSQAKCITVASRSNTSRRLVDARQLDLDEVEASDRWEILHPTAGDLPVELTEPLVDSTGTVVLWTKLDRILNRSDPFGGWAERRLLHLAGRLDEHLGMVFSRFLSGHTSLRQQRLSITINGSQVEAWDPFALDQPTERLPEKQIPVGNSFVRYRPYVLPSQRDFGDDDAWRRASGPNQWNRQQGFYIYRGDRLIQSGGWSWLRGIDEHTKLARASLDFMPELDDEFEINISKMRVKLPEELRDHLKPLVQFLTRRADDRYRKSSRSKSLPTPPSRASRGGKSPAAGDVSLSPSLHRSTVASAGPSGANSIITPTTGPPPLLKIADAFQNAAKSEGLEAELLRLRQALRRDNREVADDLGW